MAEKRKNLFEGSAAKYDETIPAHVTRHYLEKRVKFVKGIISSGTILDVGCGTGTLALRLVEEGYDVSGLDSSEAMIAECKKKGFSKVSLSESTSMTFGAASFDLVISVAAFHHIGSKEKVAATVYEMVRVCRPGGRILIWDHNPLNPYWKVFMKRLPWDNDVQRLISAGEICADLHSASIKSKIKIYKLGFVADFMPRSLLPLITIIEYVLERLPVVRQLAAHNVILAEKGE